MKTSTDHSQLIPKSVSYDLLAQFPDTILFEYDSEDRSLHFTSNISCRFHPISHNELYPFQKDPPLNFIHPADLETLLEPLRNADSIPMDKIRSFPLRLLDRNREYRWVDCQLRHKKEAPSILIGKLMDIHEERLHKQEIIEKYSRDAMTGALNRECAEKKISELLSQIKDGYLFMLDIDNFKEINDTLGHSAGDRILALFAEEMEKEFRPADIIGRIGGDEFIIFMPDASGASIAIQRAGRLLNRFSQLAGGMLTASIGISRFPGDGVSYLSLYEAADTAMYTAKRNGKNSYCFYSDLL